MQKRPKYNSIVILTGAGISAESGIRTFRGSDGLWENHAIEDVASPQGFQRDPELVYRFYNERRAQLTSGEVDPNPAHFALSKLAKEFSGNVTLVTQNVDDLHERAGSNPVVHMHGELLKMRCTRSGKVFEQREAFDASTECECCQSTGSLRPHIVWFGEMPLHMDEIQGWLVECELFISIGTSGQVYPASGFVQLAKASGPTHAIEVNLDATSVSSFFDEHLIGPAGREVPQLVERLLRN